MDEHKQPLNFNINMTGDTSTWISSSMQNTNNNNQQYSSEGGRVSIDFTNFLQHAANPGIVLFTLLFKALAVVSFLLLGIFGVSDALVFIIVVILNAFDFWFVKNVSGRILVGLRWWNEVKDDGTEVWIFESDHEKRATSIDTTLFWTSLYITPCFWGVFVVIELIGLSLMWFLVCLISFVLTFSNTVGYYKCSGEQKKKISNFLAEKGQKGFSTFLKFGANALTNNQNSGNK
jgi:hypothetical protein